MENLQQKPLQSRWADNLQGKNNSGAGTSPLPACHTSETEKSGKQKAALRSDGRGCPQNSVRHPIRRDGGRLFGSQLGLGAPTNTPIGKRERKLCTTKREKNAHLRWRMETASTKCTSSASSPPNAARESLCRLLHREGKPAA